MESPLSFDSFGTSDSILPEMTLFDEMTEFLSPGTTSSSISSQTNDTLSLSLVSMEVYTTFTYYFNYLALVVCILDVVASFANLSVYSKQRRDAFAWYLLGLTLADVVYVLMKVVRSLSLFLTDVDSYAYQFTSIYIDAGIGTCGRRVTVCLNCLASLERFLVIAFPFKVATKTLGRSPVIVITTVLVLNVVSRAYIPFLYTVGVTDNGSWGLQLTTLGWTSRQHLDTLTNVNSIVLFYTPLFLSLAINLTLVLALKRHALATKRMCRMRVTRSDQSRSRGNAHTNENLDDVVESDFTSQHVNKKTGKDSVGELPSEAVDRCLEMPKDQIETKEQEKKFSGSLRVSPWGRTLSRDNKLSRSQNQPTRQVVSRQTTTLVMLVSFSFCLLSLPATLNFTLGTFVPQYGLFKPQVYLWVMVSLASDLCTFFTQIVVFTMNIIYSTSFRNTFLSTVRAKLSHKKINMTRGDKTCASNGESFQ